MLDACCMISCDAHPLSLSTFCTFARACTWTHVHICILKACNCTWSCHARAELCCPCPSSLNWHCLWGVEGMQDSDAAVAEQLPPADCQTAMRYPHEHQLAHATSTDWPSIPQLQYHVDMEPRYSIPMQPASPDPYAHVTPVMGARWGKQAAQ